MGAVKKNEQRPNVFVRCVGIHRILLAEVERRFLMVWRLGVDQIDK